MPQIVLNINFVSQTDKEYHKSLTPEERLAIVLSWSRAPEDQRGIERVCRVVKLHRD